MHACAHFFLLLFMHYHSKRSIFPGITLVQCRGGTHDRLRSRPSDQHQEAVERSTE